MANFTFAVDGKYHFTIVTAVEVITVIGCASYDVVCALCDNVCKTTCYNCAFFNCALKIFDTLYFGLKFCKGLVAIDEFFITIFHILEDCLLVGK